MNKTAQLITLAVALILAALVGYIIKSSVGESLECIEVNGYEIEHLFTINENSVYRFKDAGQYQYFTTYSPDSIQTRKNLIKP